MLEFASPAFWVAVLQIIAIDIVLSGDNAVVIALACRNLPPEQRKKGILWGVAGAISLRVVLTAFAASLLDFPWVKLVGGFLLLWIGVKLLLPEDGGSDKIPAADHLLAAIKTIIVADFVMSMDNVIAVAAASHGNLFLLIFGLAVSIPLIIWSSQIMLKLMERFPIIIVLGAGLLGYIAGDMIVRDSAVRETLQGLLPGINYLVGAAGAILVVGLGKWLAKRKLATVDYPLS